MKQSSVALGVEERVAQLEDRLGDPTLRDNPVGYRALLEADRTAVLSQEGERLLDEFGMHAEFVPRELGGRLDSYESLIRVMRPVFRRDVALGAGYGMTGFMAASDVWIAGSRRQQEWMAQLVLSGAKVAIAQHETAHGNDFVRSQVQARRSASGGFLLSGAKPFIMNLERAQALTLFCRTGREGDSRSHSVLLLDPAELPDERSLVVPRPPSVGLRGCRFGGVEFEDCPVPESALIGPEGSGIETALRSFQISRTAMASLVLASVDTSLRTAVRFDSEHVPGGGEPMDPKRTASAMAGAFVNLLLYDCLALVATRAIHLIPEETSIYSSAVKYLLPRVLIDTMYDLSIVLGSGLYVREGTLGVFQKHLRDVPVVSLGHAGSVACQATIIPQLRGLAQRSWFIDEEAPAALFRPGAALPPPPGGEALALAGGRDSLSASLLAVASVIPGRTPAERVLRGLAAQLVDELRDLRERVLALPAQNGDGQVSPGWFALCDRYALVLAGAAVLGVWWHNQDGADPFLAEPSWAAAALHRIARNLGAPVPDLPRECDARIHHEVLARFGDRRSYDLYNAPVAG